MALFHDLAAIEQAGGSAAVATVVRTRGSVPRRAGARMLILPDGSCSGTVGGGPMEAQVIAEAVALLGSTGETRYLTYAFLDPSQGDVGVCGGQAEVFVEAVRPRPQVVVIGGGHVGKAVVELASWLDLRVVASDDRPEFCTPEVVPGADEYVPCSLAELPERVALHTRTYVLLTTRGVDIDVAGLPAVLASEAAYIGVIGSQRRWQTTEARLRDSGVDDALIARVTSPMGLELEAETPEEIALSVLAEVVMRLRGGTGAPMS